MTVESHWQELTNISARVPFQCHLQIHDHVLYMAECTAAVELLFSVFLGKVVIPVLTSKSLVLVSQQCIERPKTMPP